MKVISTNLDLGLDIFDVKLKLSNKMCFKIDDCFYSNYRWHEEKTIIISTIINNHDDNGSIQDDISSAFEKFRRANNIMSFLYGYYFDSHFDSIHSSKNIELEDLKLYYSKSGNGKRLEQFNKMYCELDKKRKELFLKCCALFSNGIYVGHKYELYEDAILNHVKILEIISSNYWNDNVKGDFFEDIENNFKHISNKYFIGIADESYDERLKIIKSDFNDTNSLRFKINKLISDKNISFINEDVYESTRKIVKMRNDIAHGNPIKQTYAEIQSVFATTWYLSLHFMSFYIFNESYLKIGLERSLEQV